MTNTCLACLAGDHDECVGTDRAGNLCTCECWDEENLDSDDDVYGNAEKYDSDKGWWET